jgi:hypothetical protein
MRPTYLYDALAAPMWNAFTTTPDLTPYDAYDIPEPLMEERNTQSAPMAATSASQLWVADAVDEGLLARIQWASRFGSDAACPRSVGPPGRQWNPCAVGDQAKRDASRARGQALVDRLRQLGSIASPAARQAWKPPSRSVTRGSPSR